MGSSCAGGHASAIVHFELSLPRPEPATGFVRRPYPRDPLAGRFRSGFSSTCTSTSRAVAIRANQSIVGAFFPLSTAWMYVRDVPARSARPCIVIPLRWINSRSRIETRSRTSSTSTTPSLSGLLVRAR